MSTPAPQPEKSKRNAIKCIRDVRSFPPATYRLHSDGRQWSHLCQQRKSLFRLLATYANGDGRNVKVAIDTLADAEGFSRRTVCRMLEDFRALGILEDGDLEPRYKNTRVRSCRVEQLQFLHEWQTALHENDIWEPSGVPSSPSGVPSSLKIPPKMAHNRLQTEVQTEEQNMDVSLKNVRHDFSFSEEEEEQTELLEGEGNGERAVIPPPYFIRLRSSLEDWLGDREELRDYGALAALWRDATGCDAERFEQVSEALENGKNYALACGGGIETLFFAAGMALDGEGGWATSW